MDAKEFYDTVVIENYKEAMADPTNFRKHWNAAVSMNTVPEYVALHRAGYPELKRPEVDALAETVRNKYPALPELKFHADTLKHVRKHEGGVVTASSTGILPQDPNTWDDLKGAVGRSYTTFSRMPEFELGPHAPS